MRSTTRPTPVMSGRRSFLKSALAAGGALALTPRDTWASPAFADLDGFVQSLMQQGVIPGAGIVVAHRGNTVLERYWGTFRAEGGGDEPLEGSVIQPCYSFSKLVSGTVFAMLCQDGLLACDVPISRYIPQFTGGGKERITLAHLLTHSAGIPAVKVGAVGNEAQWNAAIETLCAAPVEWEPGSRCVYHALTGQLVAAEAARRVTGKSWSALCRERLFEPLGASTMGFELPPKGTARLARVPRPDASVAAQLPYGFAYASWVLGHPAGGVFGTAGDMIKVMQLHLNRGQWNGKLLIKPEAFQRMHTAWYQKEIDAALASGKIPQHQTWGLGPLLRGRTMPQIAFAIPGFAELTDPDVFGHPGLDTVLTVGVPKQELAIAFFTTDSPKPATKVGDVRNGVTSRVVKATGQ